MGTHPIRVQDDTLPKAILVDIDGTVADKNDRFAFAWNKVGEDTPKEHVLNLIKVLSVRYEVIFFSGRDGCCMHDTTIWLNEHYGFSYKLFMRAAGDMRKDSIVKREMFENHIQDKYYIEAVIDDRDQVVSMWRNELHLTCLQVDYGNF